MLGKKILLVTNMYPSTKYPHYGVFVKNTANILSQEGYKVDVISLKKQDKKIEKIVAYVKFYLKTIIRGIVGKYNVIYAHYASHTGLPLLCVKMIRKNIPIVINVHGNDLVPETVEDEKYQNIVKKIIGKSKIVICPSQYFKDEVIKRCGKQADDIYIYPSGGVNISVFHPMDKFEAKSHLELEQDKKYIGYVSRIEANKGWDVFLKVGAKVLKNHPNYRLLVVGDGSQADDYDTLVEELSLRNKIDKFDLLSQQEIAYAYNAMDIFVFPTRRKSESLGLVGLEAMACGTLVIASNKYGSSSYMIDGENGFTFDPRDPDELYKIIERAISDGIRNFEAIKICCASTLDRYSVENTRKEIVSIFKKV